MPQTFLPRSLMFVVLRAFLSINKEGGLISSLISDLILTFSSLNFTDFRMRLTDFSQMFLLRMTKLQQSLKPTHFHYSDFLDGRVPIDILRHWISKTGNTDAHFCSSQSFENAQAVLNIGGATSVRRSYISLLFLAIV